MFHRRNSVFRGRFILWPKIEMTSIPTNEIARNKEFGLSTLHTTCQNPKTKAFQNAYIALLFNQDDGLSKEVWVKQEWKSKLWWRCDRLVFVKKMNIYILLPILRPSLWTLNKVWQLTPTAF